MRKFRSNERVHEKYNQLNAIIPHGGAGEGCDATKEETRERPDGEAERRLGCTVFYWRRWRKWK